MEVAYAMKKRILAVFLCLCVLLGMLPLSVSAGEMTEEERITKQIRTTYRRTLYNTGRTSMNGMCGLMTGVQLWLLGITQWQEIYDGSGFYDGFVTQDISSGGYKVKPWSATEYSLEEILYLITCGGNKDAYNLMVCFQRTRTAGGYGHAVLIHAILDGTVYFVEGFRTSLGGAEGNVIRCSIREFCQLYGDWTTFEGVIEFGNKVYTDFCESYPTELFVTAKEGAVLLSQPCSVGKNGCVVTRSTVTGERLHAVCVYKNDSGDFFYCIDDGKNLAYIDAWQTNVDRIHQENLAALNVSAPENVEPGKALPLSGSVLAKDSLIKELELKINCFNTFNTTLTLPETGCVASLGGMNRQLSNLQLAEGVYTLELYAVTSRYYVEDGSCKTREDRLPVWSTQVTVGAPSLPVVSTPERGELPQGWVFEDETWRYYQDGAPRVGWFCYGGVDYYFQPDGAVTTGWATINGKDRLFTETGAMRIGWVEDARGKCYMLSNGAAAIGWREIDGSLYCFGTDGWMLTGQTAEYNGTTYHLQDNGVAVIE